MIGIGIAITITSTIIGSFASLSLKKAMEKINLKKINFFTDFKKIFPGAFFLAISVLIYSTALNFGNVSTLFPITSLSYVWIAILAKKYLKESMTANKIMGVILIIAGVILLGVS